MQVWPRIRSSGWGALFLAIYSIFVVHYFAPQSLYTKVLALIPVAVILFLADYFNYKIVDFFAGGNLRRSAEEINQLTEGMHFYEGAGEHTKTRVDKFDNHAYEYTVSILSAVVIAITAPIFGFLVRDTFGFIVGLVLSAIAIQMLGRRSIRELNSLAQDITEPYKVNNETE